MRSVPQKQSRTMHTAASIVLRRTWAMRVPASRSTRARAGLKLAMHLFRRARLGQEPRITRPGIQRGIERLERPTL